MKYFFVSISCVVFLTIVQLQASENSLRTNWGAVLKVPVDKEDEVDRVTKNWGNWIKETHPLGADDENNLMNLSITKGEPSNGYIYYIIAEIYPTNAGLKNHQKIYSETSNTDRYRSVFAELRSVAGPYFMPGATQRHTVYNLVPSDNR